MTQTQTQTQTQINSEGRRVTPQDVNNAIVSAHYINLGSANRAAGTAFAEGKQTDDLVSAFASLSLITHCTLVLKNGYTVTGESVCVDPKNFLEALGRKVAYDKACDKVYSLLACIIKTEITGTKLI